MTTSDVLHCLQREIHTVVAATTDEDGLPVTCAVDLMDADEQGLYFLTARGKGFYNRLQRQGFLALTGMKGEDTMSCVAVSLRGRVRELGEEPLPRLFAKNPYMAQIYPSAQSRRALTVFQLWTGEGEWFDLSQTPIERFSFSFGHAAAEEHGYFVGDECTGCRACAPVCPQGCIVFPEGKAVIQQEHCLRCGNCLAVCPSRAVERR